MSSHILFILMILFSSWMIYVAWFRRYGEKFFYSNQRLPAYFRWFWPKDVKGSIIMYRTMAILIFIISVVSEILVILNILE
jgi:hypothetical protein